MMSMSGLCVAVTAAAAGIILFIRHRRSLSWNNFDCDKYKGKIKDLRVVVTGGNSGLGFQTATILAKLGAAKVVLACRDMDRGVAAANDIRIATGNDNIVAKHLDLASLESIRDFVRSIDAPNCLVCNAGVWVPREKGMKTEDGFEIHFGVNHLGHFLLTRLLMEKVEDLRVVVVSSSLMNVGQLDMAAKDFVYQGRATEKVKGHAPAAYADSKLMNGLFVKELARRYPLVSAYTCCPGWCKTELARYVTASFLLKLMFLPVVAMFMRSAARGCVNIVQLVVMEKELLESGAFYREGVVAKQEIEKLDKLKNEGEELWDLSEELTGLK